MSSHMQYMTNLWLNFFKLTVQYLLLFNLLCSMCFAELCATDLCECSMYFYV